MRPLYKGLALGLIHLALVASLGAKMLYDRATRPRVWVRTAPADPDLPIRGRYVSMRLEVPARGFPQPAAPSAPSPGGVRVASAAYEQATLRLEEGHLVAFPAQTSEGFGVRLRVTDNAVVADVLEPIAFFIPEHVVDPARRPLGEQLWVEVTIPRKGLPRPIRLGVVKDGALTPLDLR